MGVGQDHHLDGPVPKGHYAPQKPNRVQRAWAAIDQDLLTARRGNEDGITLPYVDEDDAERAVPLGYRRRSIEGRPPKPRRR